MKNKISSEGIETLLNQFITNSNEERDLALERYRRQDEQMESAEDFVSQGKQAVDYLKVAAERSNALLAAAKLIKEMVYTAEGVAKGSKGSDLSSDDELRNKIIKMAKEAAAK